MPQLVQRHQIPSQLLHQHIPLVGTRRRILPLGNLQTHSVNPRPLDRPHQPSVSPQLLVRPQRLVQELDLVNRPCPGVRLARRLLWVEVLRLGNLQR